MKRKTKRQNKQEASKNDDSLYNVIHLSELKTGIFETSTEKVDIDTLLEYLADESE